MTKTSIVIPNWNGADMISPCLESLEKQTSKAQVIVVDNGSTDNSVELIEKKYPWVIQHKNKRNLGFAGGVNTGIRLAIKQGYEYVALINNDATASRDWLENLEKFLDMNKEAGIVTSRIVDATGKHIDSTGEMYTVWGLTYPRDRGLLVNEAHSKSKWIFGASGGASLYRVEMFQEIGLFDEDFFAYYEDVDISFRAQLAGWKIGYEPTAIANHAIGATSKNISGFATYHTLKNLPLLFWKNVPWSLMPKIWPRIVFAYSAFALKALLSGRFGPFFKGIFMATILWPKKLIQRSKIQRKRRVNTDYINSIITHDLPPNAMSLRKLRGHWWKLFRKRTT